MREQLELNNKDFTIAMFNWRDILDEYDLMILSQFNTIDRAKERILNILNEAVDDNVIGKEDRQALLRSVLESIS